MQYMNFELTDIDRRCLGLEFGRRRRLANIKQVDVAEYFGKTRNWLSEIESGKITINLIDAFHMCEMYQCDLSEVLRIAVSTTKDLKRIK